MDLTQQADLLLSQQNIEEANIELIKSKVELANSQYGVTLLSNLYLGLLSDGKDVNSLIEMINENAEKTKIAAEEAEAEILAIEARKAERAIKIEAERAAKQEANIVNHERQAELEARRVADRAEWKAQAEEKQKESERATREQQIQEEEKAKAEVVTQSPPENEVVTEPLVNATETYTVTGTEAQLDNLEE